MERTTQKESPLVLVVDDDVTTRLLARESMEQAGFRVEEAEDGAAALSIFADLHPDIVLLDLMMPRMDGFDTCAALRSLPEGIHTPVLMMTGLDDVQSITRAYEVGATDFITKPINYMVLTHRVRYMLRASQLREALAEQAIRDTLTGLYNRRYFSRRMVEEFSRADRNNQILAILLCDIDHFKTINDTLGHQVGDEALKSVAKNIQESTRGTDLVFRWGGDEIVVVLSDTHRDGILTAAERIRKGIEKVQEKIHADLDMSIGIALYPEHGRTIDELIRVADTALYIAKKGGGKINIGAREYHVDEHSIKIVFQPVINVQPIKNMRTEQVLGYEALSRDPEGKLDILDLFKKYQAIGKLEELKCICFRSQIKAAQEARLKRVFINVDFGVLCQFEVIPKPPEIDIILEISEREALRDIPNLLTVTSQWRKAGYKFAIDDFGAGFISLPFISELVPEYIKIDRSTILQAVSTGKFRTFSKDLVKALRNYSSEGIIAEGVETEKELQVVKEMGINLVQGFLLGKPQVLKPPTG